MHTELETISLINVDIKILSKAISTKLKTVFPTLISSQQTAYIKNRFRLISYVIEISDCFNILQVVL